MSHDHSPAAGLLAQAREDFSAKQERFMDEIAEFPRRAIDEDNATLTFHAESGMSRAYSLVPIGTWLPKDNDWAWAWANDAFPDAARQRSETLKAFDDPRFTRPSFHAHAEDVGDLCVLAIHVLDAHGQFRTMGDLRAYYAVQPA